MKILGWRTEGQWKADIKQACLHNRYDTELINNWDALEGKLGRFEADIALMQKYPDAVKRDIAVGNPGLTDSEVNQEASDELVAKKKKRDATKERITLISKEIEFRADGISIGMG